MYFTLDKDGKPLKTTLAGNDKKRVNHYEAHPAIEDFFRFTQWARNRDYQVRSSNGYDEKYRVQVDYLDIYTELDLPWPYSETGEIQPEEMLKFRCHPDYKGEGAWYDWCVAEYEPGIDPRTGEEIPVTNHVFYEIGKKKKDLWSFWNNNIYPNKILGFVKGKWRLAPNEPIDKNQMTDPTERDRALEPVDENGDYIPWSEDEQIFALVHGCVDRTGKLYEMSSVLTENWHLEYQIQKKRNPADEGKIAGETLDGDLQELSPTLRLIKAHQIWDRAFVVEEDPGMSRDVPVEDARGTDAFRSVVVLRKYGDWKDQFIG